MKSEKQKIIDIADYYTIKVASIWTGLKQESAAFWCLCIYLFFEYVRPQSIYTQIDVLPWSQVFLVLTVITVFLDRSIKWVRNPENLLFFLFMLLLTISAVFAFNPAGAWEKFRIMLNWFVLYFLMITIVNTEKRFIVFMLLFLLVSLKMSQHGFMNFAMRGFSFADWGATGAPGWFQNSGEFAIQMVIYTPLSIAFIFALQSYWGRYKRVFFYLMPFTAIMSIIASSSRGGQLAFVIVGCWYLLKSKLGLKFIFGIVTVAVLFVYFMPEEQIARFEEMGDDKTSEQRFAYWSYGLTMIKNHSGLGVGLGSWKEYCWFDNPDGVGPKHSCQEPHNIFVQGASELGVPAMLIFILMALFILILNARTRQIAGRIDNRMLGAIAHGLDGGLIGYLVAGFFVTVLYYPFFWMQMSISVVLYSVAKGLMPENQGRRFRSRFQNHTS